MHTRKEKEEPFTFHQRHILLGYRKDAPLASNEKFLRNFTSFQLIQGQSIIRKFKQKNVSIRNVPITILEVQFHITFIAP